jgi:GNAT superfamily N-acetyltransferase
LTESITLEITPRLEDVRVIRDGLRAFTDAKVGPVNSRPFALLVRDQTDNVVGGLDAEIRWTWLFIAHLWLPEAFRGRGLGGRLLAQAEEFGRQQNCVAAYLDTLEFQALSFYQHRGYIPYGVLDGFPPSSRRFYLQKRLR